MNNNNVTILDIYNADIYPNRNSTRKRVNISVPLSSGTNGDIYLRKYSDALSELHSDYRMAFVIAGTDVLVTDKLGGLNLTIDDVVQREKMTLEKLKTLGVPTVVLGGGGYSKESAKCVAQAILACSV